MHPRLAAALHGLGRAALADGDRESTRRFLDEALAVRRSTTPGHPEVRALESELSRLP